MSRLLMRFDDVTPGMRWDIWERLEKFLLEQNIKPILGVIPDNCDASLEHQQRRPEFWQRMVSLQSSGWAIGMHGYQHSYITRNPGCVGSNHYSEFAGLPYDIQLQALQRAMQLMQSHGIKPSLFVAPAHTFDGSTIKALLSIGIDRLSDGFSLYPYRDEEGMFWIPQQIWRARPLPLGVWTVCYHHNNWSESDFERFRKQVIRFRKYWSDLETVTKLYGSRKLSLTDQLSSRILKGRIRIDPTPPTVGILMRAWPGRKLQFEESNASSPRYSIITATYNRAEKLKVAIASVINQSYPNWELIVIDDGSSDNTIEVLRTFNDPRIKYRILEKNVGVNPARNLAISEARGEWIIILDSDNALLPHALETIERIVTEDRRPLYEFFCENFNGVLTCNDSRLTGDLTFAAHLRGEVRGEHHPVARSDVLKAQRFREDLSGGEGITWREILRAYGDGLVVPIVISRYDDSSTDRLSTRNRNYRRLANVFTCDLKVFWADYLRFARIQGLRVFIRFVIYRALACIVRSSP